jgi:hypothetical protein
VALRDVASFPHQAGAIDGLDGFFAQPRQKYVSDRTHSVVAMNLPEIKKLYLILDSINKR